MNCDCLMFCMLVVTHMMLSSDWPAGPDTPWRDTLLLACRYFDRGLAGYVDEDDLRRIALMTGDYMSRARTPSS